jgi:hypothetical protein
MSENAQGSNNTGESQSPATESPAVETKTGASANSGEKPQLKAAPPASFFVNARKQEKENKDLRDTVLRMQQQLDEMSRSRPAANTWEDETSQTPPQPARKPAVAADDLDSRFKEFESRIHQGARVSVADQWLSQQKHVEDPRFAEVVAQKVQEIREHEAFYGYKSDPILIAEKAYNDTAAAFGVKPAAPVTPPASAARSSSQVPPSAGSSSGGSTADQDTVSLKVIAEKQKQALRDRDGAEYDRLAALRDKARSSGRLRP